jgi:hypothetical protein
MHDGFFNNTMASDTTLDVRIDHGSDSAAAAAGEASLYAHAYPETLWY